MRSITEIIVHCTATPEGKPFTVQQIREWHTAPKPKGNGWRDIGYHYIVYLDGSVHNGRPVEQIGAHCSGHNAHSIGVCYVGVYARENRRVEKCVFDGDRQAVIGKGTITALSMLLEAISGVQPQIK